MFKEVRKKVEVYLWYMFLHVKSCYQYKKAFLLRSCVVFFTYFCEFIATCFLVGKFNNIKGWSVYEILLIYGMSTVAYAIARFLFNGFNSMSKQIKDGSLFMNMIRPINEKYLIMAQGINIERLGQALLGIVIIIYACLKLEKKIRVVLLVVYILNGIFIYGGLFLIGAALAFWIVDSKEITGIMTHGTLRAIVYPISIYKKSLKYLFTYIIPVAFVSYYPAIVLLEKKENANISIMTCCIGIFLFCISLLMWRIGIKKYEGSGG